MNETKLNEEKFREACSYDDKESLIKLISQGVNINSQNSVNGWSGLHWACKRGHTDAVTFLLASGADANIQTFKHETPAELTTKHEILSLLDTFPKPQIYNSGISRERNLEEPLREKNQSSSPPGSSCNFESVISNIFDYDSKLSNGIISENGSPSRPSTGSTLTQTSPQHFCRNAQTSTENQHSSKEVILKVRVADISDTDFIEVEFFPSELSYRSLLTVCSRELGINPQLIERVRKLPNTRLRNDKDVQRLKSMEELEFVVKGLSSRSISVATSLQNNSINNVKQITGFKNQTILY